METWTRSRVLALVDGCRIFLHDRRARTITPPGWLLAGGAHTVATSSSGELVATAHPDDRPQLVEAWWEATHHPGEVIETGYRVQRDGALIPVTSWFLNLYDDPVLGALLIASAYGEGVVDEVPRERQSGEFEETRWLMHIVDEQAVILETEGMVHEILGRDPEEVIGQATIDHIHPDSFGDALTSWMEVQNGPVGTSRTSRLRLVKPDGEIVWVESTSIKRVGAGGEPRNLIFVADLTERRRQEAELRASRHQFRTLADQVPAAVFTTDADQRIVFRNARWIDLGAYAAVGHLYELVHPDDRARYDEELAALDTGPVDATTAVEVRSSDGEQVFAITCCLLVDLINDERSYVGSVADITATVRLRHRADNDALTGLANRGSVLHQLALALEGDHAGTVLVAFVDLDGFKGVNDTHGHEVGDLVLQGVAERLRTCVRPDDVVGRFGGDEFVLVLRDGEAAGTVLRERIGRALAEPITWAGGSWSPAASVGVARAEADDDPARILRRADHAMYEIKRVRNATA